MRRLLAIVLNVVAYDALWAVAIVGATRSWWWAGPLLIVVSAAGQLVLSPSPGREALVILAGSLVGVGLDYAALRMGLLSFDGGAGAFVLVFFALWVNFGTTLRPSLSWMWRRPVLAAGLGAVGGPLAYWVGSRIGAIGLGERMWMTLAWVGVQYGVVLPIWMRLARGVLTPPGGTDRRSSAPAATPAEGRPAA
ncbi:MAG: DUF2878 domain-containing protein [Planctomycetota bacterium]|nr:DUF2878 domain-containing protein [Planctomycetota bacterium]